MCLKALRLDLHEELLALTRFFEAIYLVIGSAEYFFSKKVKHVRLIVLNCFFKQCKSFCSTIFAQWKVGLMFPSSGEDSLVFLSGLQDYQGIATPSGQEAKTLNIE